VWREDGDVLKNLLTGNINKKCPLETRWKDTVERI